MLTKLTNAQNRSNFDAHYNGTGPEIWRQTNSYVDAFVSGAGAHVLCSICPGFQYYMN